MIDVDAYTGIAPYKAVFEGSLLVPRPRYKQQSARPLCAKDAPSRRQSIGHRVFPALTQTPTQEEPAEEIPPKVMLDSNLPSTQPDSPYSKNLTVH